jgi:hypothetical protein
MTVNVAPDIGQLQELPLPAPTFSYLPQTWGWVILALMLLALMMFFYLWRRQRWRRDRYRREALTRLELIAQKLMDPQLRVVALREIPELIKRVALSMQGNEPVAALRGEQWQAFLQRHTSQSIPNDLAKQLAELAYQPGERLAALKGEQLRELLDVCRRWIEVHHVAV